MNYQSCKGHKYYQSRYYSKSKEMFIMNYNFDCNFNSIISSSSCSSESKSSNNSCCKSKKSNKSCKRDKKSHGCSKKQCRKMHKYCK